MVCTTTLLFILGFFKNVPIHSLKPTFLQKKIFSAVIILQSYILGVAVKTFYSDHKQTQDHHMVTFSRGASPWLRPEFLGALNR